jgi:hypothetical protein
LLDENPAQTQQVLADELRIIQKAFLLRLHVKNTERNKIIAARAN